jgi:lipoprotein-anchoring transpeptidase ErfK/SrfK
MRTTLLNPKGNRMRGGQMRRLAALVAMSAALAACGAQRPVLAPVNPRLRATTTTAAALIPTSGPETTSGPVTTARQPSFRRLHAGTTTMHGLIATPIGNPVVHKNPSLTSPLIPVARLNPLGVNTVFAIIGNDSTPWIEVLLPTRPNGTIGWVQRSEVRVATTDARVFVNLARRLLTVTRGKYTLMQARIATGTVTNPTPTGPTFVTELIDTGDANGTYGPYAFGLALHSNTLTEFGGGDGQVGIHGTNTPNLIGQRVSHGCVRLTNENVRRLVSLKLALGTPVFIR